MFGIGLPELLIILVIALIVFGPKKLPDLAKSLGKGIAEFKKVTDEFKSTVESDLSGIENEFKDVKKDLTEVASQAEIQVGSEAAPPEPRPFANPFAASSSLVEDQDVKKDLTEVASQAEIQVTSEAAPPEPQLFANPFMARRSLVEDREKGKVETAEISEIAPSTIPAAQVTSPPKEEDPATPTKEPV
jgi:TatA/E family protein of Tat protein translocase